MLSNLLITLFKSLPRYGRIHETVIGAQSQTMYSKKLGATIVLSRSLSQTAMHKELNVDGELLRSLAGVNGAEGNSFNIRVRYKSRDYEVKCRSRKGKYKKWVFAGRGWLDLVRGNGNLKAGQPITIFKLPDGTAGTGAGDGDLFFMKDGPVTVSSGPKVLKRRARRVTAGYDYSVLSAAEMLMDLGRADGMIDLNSPPSPILDLNSVPCDCF